MPRHAFTAIFSIAAAGLSGCIPYSVGTTATPVPSGQRATTLSVTAMPSFALFDSTGGRWMSLDGDSRLPIDNRSDVGFRAVGGAGLVVSYKRLLSDSSSKTRVAVMPGFGFLNLASHAHFETTLLVSGYEPQGSAARVDGRPPLVPYGGLRVMQVAPLSSDAVHDAPTAGGFFGL